jgi:hypothetical protein
MGIPLLPLPLSSSLDLLSLLCALCVLRASAFGHSERKGDDLLLGVPILSGRAVFASSGLAGENPRPDPVGSPSGRRFSVSLVVKASAVSLCALCVRRLPRLCRGRGRGVSCLALHLRKCSHVCGVITSAARDLLFPFHHHLPPPRSLRSLLPRAERGGARRCPSPHAWGFSGGGVWFHKSPTAVWHPNLGLAGICTAYYAQSKVLSVVKIEHVICSLKKLLPEAAVAKAQ